MWQQRTQQCVITWKNFPHCCLLVDGIRLWFLKQWKTMQIFRIFFVIRLKNLLHKQSSGYGDLRRLNAYITSLEYIMVVVLILVVTVNFPSDNVVSVLNCVWDSQYAPEHIACRIYAPAKQSVPYARWTHIRATAWKSIYLFVLFRRRLLLTWINFNPSRVSRRARFNL